MVNYVIHINIYEMFCSVSAICTIVNALNCELIVLDSNSDKLTCDTLLHRLAICSDSGQCRLGRCQICESQDLASDGLHVLLIKVLE